MNLGNFDVSNTADNPHCKLAVPSVGTNLTAYLLDPHTVQGGCYEYLLADGSMPTRRRLEVPDWHNVQTYNSSTLNIDFVVSNVQCKCPPVGTDPSNVGTEGGFLDHCDVPFYQKVTFTRTEDEDHSA